MPVQSPSDNQLMTSVSTHGLTRCKPIRVFNTELFDLYVARLVRKGIAEQYVDEGHMVLNDEIRLISESQMSLKAHLSRTVPEWKMAWRLAKMVVIHHVRQLAKERLECHDIDDDTKEAALESIYRLDFEELFPSSWLDGWLRTHHFLRGKHSAIRDTKSLQIHNGGVS